MLYLGLQKVFNREIFTIMVDPLIMLDPQILILYDIELYNARSILYVDMIL